MASFRPFPTPQPSSSFSPLPPPNQAPLPPRPTLHHPAVSGAGHPYPQHGCFPTSAYGSAPLPYLFPNPPAGPQHNQQQYTYPHPPAMTGQSLPSSSYPPLPPLAQPAQPPHPQYYPSSQYPYYNPPPQPPAPPPPPASTPPILSSSFPPPPPPPTSPPPPPPPPTHPELSRKPSTTAPAPAPAATSFRHQKPNTLPPGKPLLHGSGRMETEEERSIRKRREFEKQKLEERRQHMLKQSQAKVLQKTQILSASGGGVRANARLQGSLVGSRLGDRRTAPFLASDRIENRLKKPTTFICKMK